MIDRTCSLLKMRPPLKNRGYLFGSGTVVPTDGTDGWQTGALFQKTDGGSGTAAYLNEGSVTSSAFVRIESPGGSLTLADLQDVADGFATRLLETGTYASAVNKGVVLSATNQRPAAFCYDDGGAVLGAGNYRGVLSRIYLGSTQTGAVAIRAIRGQVKPADGLTLNLTAAEFETICGVEGYMELAGATGRTIGANTRVSALSALLEINQSITLTSGGKVCGALIQLCQTTAKSVGGIGTAGVAVDRVDSDHSTHQAAWTTGFVTGANSCATGIMLGAASTEAITILTQAASIMTAGLTTSGSSKLDGIDFNWTTATTYGSGGDRWGGNGNMEAFLTIGDDAAAAVVSGAGSHLGQYINLSYTGTAGNANDLCGGLYAAVSYGATETQGKVCGITSHIRNPDQSISGANQECNAIRALMYTGTGGETQHYCGILVGVLDMTTTKSNAQDIIGMRVQLNVANNSGGGNLSGVVFDNVGTVEPDTGLWYLQNEWTYAMVAADGGATPKPATDSGTCGTAAGAIAVKVGGSVRYIPLYTTYSA